TRVASFDHLVGTREQSRGDFEAERLGRFEVYDQFELGRLLHGQVSRFLTLQDAVWFYAFIRARHSRCSFLIVAEAVSWAAMSQEARRSSKSSPMRRACRGCAAWMAPRSKPIACSSLCLSLEPAWGPKSTFVGLAAIRRCRNLLSV